MSIMHDQQAGRSLVAIDARIDPKTPRDAIRGPTRVGLVIIVLFVAVFVGWGSTVPLAGGAVAPGIIAPDGSVRTVQHLEGGIVDRILVREGDVVEAGAPLLALSRVQNETDFKALTDRARARLAEHARLTAELNGSKEIRFPDELRSNPMATEVMAAETRIFEARTAMISARKRVLAQRIEQLHEQIRGFEAQVESATLQLTLLDEETEDKSNLFKQGLSPKSELMRLKRSAAEIQGFRGEYSASIASALQQIGLAEIELLALDAERMEQVSIRASEVRGELAEIDQLLAARQDVLSRTLVTAPIAGVIANLQVKTRGGVIGPGEEILDIVPTEESLLVDAHIAPVDVDVVEIGMTAKIALRALSARTTPQVNGVVTSISADRIVDAETGRPYFLVRVKVDRSELDAHVDAELTVGMPADVIIVAQERTMAAYLMQPFLDAIRRAGREV